MADTKVEIEKDVVVIQPKCSPTTLVDSGSTAYSIVAKIKSFFTNTNTKLDNIATKVGSAAPGSANDSISWKSDITAAKNEVLAKTGSSTDASSADTIFGRLNFLKENSSAEVKSEVEDVIRRVESIRSKIHRDGLLSGNNTLVSGGYVYDFIGYETIGGVSCREWSCPSYKSYRYFTKNSEPLAAGSKLYFLSNGSLAQWANITDVSTESVALKSDITSTVGSNADTTESTTLFGWVKKIFSKVGSASKENTTIASAIPVASITAYTEESTSPVVFNYLRMFTADSNAYYYFEDENGNYDYAVRVSGFGVGSRAYEATEDEGVWSVEETEYTVISVKYAQYTIGDRIGTHYDGSSVDTLFGNVHKTHSKLDSLRQEVGDFGSSNAAAEIANISQELGNLSAIFSGITAQDITDEYNAE